MAESHNIKWLQREYDTFHSYRVHKREQFRISIEHSQDGWIVSKCVNFYEILQNILYVNDDAIASEFERMKNLSSVKCVQSHRI